MNLLKSASLLHFLATQNPRVWEIIHPHEPITSEGVRYLMAASVVKAITAKISDPKIAADLNRAGKHLFDAGLKVMTYENISWTPGDEVSLNPQPEPPGRPAHLGAVINLVADSITSVDLRSTTDLLRQKAAILMNT